MDRPPAHHPECTCEDEELSERVVSASNTIIEFSSDVAAGHQLCSYNMLVAALFLVEFVIDACDTTDDSDTVTKARETAKKFYQYSSSSNRRLN